MSEAVDSDRRLTVVAALASVAVHVLVLIVFGAVRLSRGPSGGGANASPPVVAQIQQLLERSPVTPKPKTQPIFASHRLIPAGKRPLDVAGIGKNELDVPTVDVWQDARDPLEFSDATGRGTRVSFFDQETTVRKICYVVDCTGSMHGRLGHVKEQLTRSIQKLEPDQFFYIIFFLDGHRLLETGGGKMVRATPAAKARAQTFIASARPSGATNAVQALRRAMEIRDSLGRGPQLIYFLTDGFDLGEDVGIDDFVAQIEQVRRQYAPQTRIHTIGFWTEPGDVEILKRVAAQSGGVFTNVQ